MTTRIARRLHSPVVFRQQRLPPDHPRRAPARSAVVPRGGFPMKHMPTACCLLAGLAIAASGTASAQNARPDKPPMSIEQRKALGEAMAQRNRDLKQPRTEARSEEHTSELQSLMRNSYARICLKTKKRKQ